MSKRETLQELLNTVAWADTPEERDEAERAVHAMLEQAWEEGFFDGERQGAEGDDGPKFVNPYKEERAE